MGRIEGGEPQGLKTGAVGSPPLLAHSYRTDRGVNAQAYTDLIVGLAATVTIAVYGF